MAENIKRHLTNINVQLLGAFAFLASTLALVGGTKLCAFWFHQPEMPESLREID